jgi:hypothetical protein
MCVVIGIYEWGDWVYVGGEIGMCVCGGGVCVCGVCAAGDRVYALWRWLFVRADWCMYVNMEMDMYNV